MYKTCINYNNPELTRNMLPSLMKASNNQAFITNARTVAEDFSYFAEKVPSLYIFCGRQHQRKKIRERPHLTIRLISSLMNRPCKQA